MPPWPTLAWVAAVLSLERVCYVWASRWPASFRAVCAAWPAGPVDPVSAVQGLFVGFKVVQAAVFVWWCLAVGGRLWPPDAPVGAMASGVLLMGVGQTLNAWAFGRLGRVGVFYGNRFGRMLPRVEGFPFSVCAHPQYTGAVLTIWGVFLVMRYPHGDWYAVPAVETVLYAISARAER